MKSSYILVKLSLSSACLLLYNAVVFAQDPELVRHFDYDAKAPLDLKITWIKEIVSLSQNAACDP